jgi:hypothetical protein
MDDWKETYLYKQGLFHLKLGKLLMKPNSRMSDFVKLASEYDLLADVVFKIIPQDEEEINGDTQS